MLWFMFRMGLIFEIAFTKVFASLSGKLVLKTEFVTLFAIVSAIGLQ